jgi:hypothetical protein
VSDSCAATAVRILGTQNRIIVTPAAGAVGTTDEASLILSPGGSRYLSLSRAPRFECRPVPCSYLMVAKVSAATLMPGNNDENPSRRGPLIALAVVVVLFVVGWILANTLYSNGKLEDCLLSGRTNCAPVDTQSR